MRSEINHENKDMPNQTSGESRFETNGLGWAGMSERNGTERGRRRWIGAAGQHK